MGLRVNSGVNEEGTFLLFGFGGVSRDIGSFSAVSFVWGNPGGVQCI